MKREIIILLMDEIAAQRREYWKVGGHGVKTRFSCALKDAWEFSDQTQGEGFLCG